jgi:cyclic pyranopterin phosphate synthase
MSRPDFFRIDSHKLFFHPRRVAQWLDGAITYPLYMEISPAGACNHRCTFCAKDYLGYRHRFLDTDLLRERLTEFASLGVRSIMYGGEGEPLLHDDISRIIKHTRSVGIDVAMSTNGVLLRPELAEQILPEMSWIKISINAGSPDGYASIHRTDPEDFEKVFANLASAARLVDACKWPCVLGTQAVLLPENAAEMELLAQRSKDAGARYLVVKPYSQHGKSHTHWYQDLDYAPYLDLQESLERFNDSGFSVIFRMNTINKMQRTERGYGRCLALPFWSYIDAGGDVWGCSSFIGDDNFLYGNINDDNFQDIWIGERRRRSLESVAESLNPEECRMNCRMDEINHYLWELTHPGSHVNFI